MSSVPALQNLPAGSQGSNAGPPTPHAKSGRRLSKSVLRADSQDVEGSKIWGVVSVRDHQGEEQRVRVVQKEEVETFNMIKVSWFWTWQGTTHQVELRHGRKSGIRKISVDKHEIERVKTVKNLVADSGSTHSFQVGGKPADIMIAPKGSSGFTYQLMIDGNAIEQNIVGPMSDLPLDIGTRSIELPKTDDGLGMTLRNNPLQMGVVVWSVEDGKAADKAGIKVGDVVLSIETHLVDSIDNLVAYVAECTEGIVHMEVAGTAPSRIVSMVKSKENPKVGLGLQTTSCGIGILVTEIDADGTAAQSHLKVGDSILSVDDVVPTSPKHAVQLIMGSEYAVKFVVIGHADFLPDSNVEV